MARLAELQRVLTSPLEYLHPERFSVPLLMDTAEARTHLNALIVQGMGWADSETQDTVAAPWLGYWLQHWEELTLIAGIIGAQLQRAQLARAGALLHLDTAQRAFIRADLDLRSHACRPEGASVAQWVQATGLNALLAWETHMPRALMQRLPLQFSPQVAAWQQAMPALPMDIPLFFLAVQHAQLHQTAR